MSNKQTHTDTCAEFKQLIIWEVSLKVKYTTFYSTVLPSFARFDYLAFDYLGLLAY